jgi:glycosyltransferase involved in cell wall biosynthesis
MKRIGVYLAAEPTGGGTFQYNLSIIQALKDLNKNQYEITAFIHNKEWLNYLPSDFNIFFKKKAVFKKFLNKIYRLLNRSDNAPLLFASFFNPIINTINKSNCNIVIMPSQDEATYQITKNSISTIHDLMHRYESHFDEYQNGEFQIREKHYSLICKFADAILVDSKVGKEQVIESYNVEPNKVFVLPFVPPFYLHNSENTEIELKYNLPKNYFFYPAQFWEHKNHVNLLKALKILHDHNIATNLVLVGSKKNNFQKVIDLIDELGLAKNVYVLGYVSNNDMASLYRNAIATTFVSLIGPTNIPPLEAMYLGCPLICSKVYGMPEQVGDAALLIDPLDPKDIAQKMNMILGDPLLAKQCIQKGKKVIESYGQKEFSQKLENYLNLVIDNI